MSKADWPPDPYLIYGANKIINKADTSIEMLGEKSPISNLQILKKIEIDSNGKILITSTAENISNKNVSWDLWMLTRFDVYSNVYVPIDKDGIQEFVKLENESIDVTPYKIENNYFTFIPSEPCKNKTEQVQEVHLYPNANYMVTFSEEQMLKIKFVKIGKEKIHANHGLVELYSYIDNKNNNLLELEVHSEYKTLEPGEKMSLTETWELKPYEGANNSKEQIKFIKRNN